MDWWPAKNNRFDTVLDGIFSITTEAIPRKVERKLAVFCTRHRNRKAEEATLDRRHSPQCATNLEEVYIDKYDIYIHINK